MRSRFVRPETRRLELTDGDWLLVKCRLTHGETMDAFGREVRVADDGTTQIDPLKVADSKVLAYLLDWSFPEFPIHGQPIAVVAAALRGLEQDDFAEIKAAIDAHEEVMRDAREAEKKTPAGTTRSAPTSPSLAAVAGAMTTSVI